MMSCTPPGSSRSSYIEPVPVPPAPVPVGEVTLSNAERKLGSFTDSAVGLPSSSITSLYIRKARCCSNSVATGSTSLVTGPLAKPSDAVPM